MKHFIQKLPQAIPFTQQGYDALIAEKEKLSEERKIAVSELQRAREMGDLKENGFYRGAKFKLIAIDRRLRELTRLIRFGKIVPAQSDTNVSIGSKVLVDDGKEKREFFIVGEYEANPSENKLSNKSPIGKELIGKKIGETITIYVPAGKIQYTILQINST